MMRNILSLAALGLLSLGEQVSEAGTWASMPEKIFGNPFTAAFGDVVTGFGEVHGQRYGSGRLLTSAEYQLAFYHHYPDDSLICFKYGGGILTLDSEIGPLKYQDVKFTKFTSEVSGQLYVGIINASNASTCGSGESIDGGTKKLSLLTSFSNTVGWGVGTTGQGKMEANRARDGDGWETIAQKHVNVILQNGAIGFSSCTVSLSVDGVSAVEFSGVRMGDGKEVTLGCVELPSSPVTAAWTCDGSSYMKELNLESASCSGSTLQISLIGKKADSFFPPVVVLHSGTDSCPETCSAIPDTATKSYGIVLYHYVPKTNHFICFKYGFSMFMWTTSGPFKYKDVHYLSVSYPHTRFYFDVIEAQSTDVCGSGSVSLVNGLKEASLVDSAQNTFGYSPQSPGLDGVDANRALKDGRIDIVGVDEVNILFFNNARGFGGSCSVRGAVGGEDKLMLGSIKLGSGKELTQGCDEVPHDTTAVIWTCDGEEFKWDSGLGGLQAAVCAGSSQQFSLVGEKGSTGATAPEVLLLSGAAAGCQSCVSQMMTTTMSTAATSVFADISTSAAPSCWLLLLCSICVLSDVIKA